jgi:hypothetical protein
MTRITFQPCCGLERSVPATILVGGLFVLKPCPRCGHTFSGRLVDQDFIEQLPFSLQDELAHANRN